MDKVSKGSKVLFGGAKNDVFYRAGQGKTGPKIGLFLWNRSKFTDEKRRIFENFFPVAGMEPLTPWIVKDSIRSFSINTVSSFL